MSEETPTASHLFDVMTTDQGDMTATTGKNGVTSSSSHDGGVSYFESLVLVIGIIGTAANGLILYALVASKQHKKQALIFHQNAIDLYGCVILVITYGLLLSKIRPSGSLGKWLCTFLLNGALLQFGTFASSANLMMISIERYLKVVHSAWSKTKLRKWMTYAAMACAWISGIPHVMVMMVKYSVVIDGVCYGYEVASHEVKVVFSIYYFLFTYLFMLAISSFCYGKILMVIRRQARVMASHNPGGSNAAQAQSNQIQTNVIKTMIFVCAFCAIAWLPEKLFTLLIFSESMASNLTFAYNAYYVSTFLGFLYICAKLTIIATRRCLNVVS